MKKFMKEVEEKIQQKEIYEKNREELYKSSRAYDNYSKLIECIEDWLNEQVDLDLPIYFTRLSYYNYLKDKEKEDIESNSIDTLIYPNNPGLNAKLYEYMCEKDEEYKLNTDNIQNISDIITVFKLLDIRVAKLDLLKSGIESEILERLFNYKENN